MSHVLNLSSASFILWKLFVFQIIISPEVSVKFKHHQAVFVSVTFWDRAVWLQRGDVLGLGRIIYGLEINLPPNQASWQLTDKGQQISLRRMEEGILNKKDVGMGKVYKQGKERENVKA